MKKILCLVLAAAMLAVILLPFAIAEVAIEPETAHIVKVDLTGLIVSLLIVVFEFLLAWIIKAVIPPLRLWLEARTTNEQRSLLYNVVKELVEAAENTILGVGKGKQKMDYVKKGLEARGFTVDIDMIESAVKNMNDEWALRLIQAMNGEDVDEEFIIEKDEPEPEVEETDPDN